MLNLPMVTSGRTKREPAAAKPVTEPEETPEINIYNPAKRRGRVSKAQLSLARGEVTPVIKSLPHEGNRVSREVMAQLLGISREEMLKRKTAGCPFNSDDSCFVHQVLQWQIDNELAKNTKSSMPSDLSSIDLRKKKAEVERIEAQTQKLRGEYMERSEHETILTSRAAAMSSFMESASSHNANRFVGLTLDEARVNLHGFCKKAMQVYTGEI